MAKKLLEIASELVQAQVSTSQMSAQEISLSLKQVFNSLQEIQRCEAEGASMDLSASREEMGVEEGGPERIDPKDSIKDDKVICLECGAEMRQLTGRHLQSHELTPRQYKEKYGFPLRQPLAAKSLSKARSKAAKKRGLPEKLALYIEERRQKKLEAAAASLAPIETPFGEINEAPPVAKRGRKKKSDDQTT